MKHLRQYIRRTILSEGIKSPNDLLPGSYILAKLNPKVSSVKLMVPYSDTPFEHHVAAELDWGTLFLNKPCMGASEVMSVEVYYDDLEEAGYSDVDGWGPLLYDIAMEFQGEKGLMCDRDEVSDDASWVWEKYLTSRDDVQPKVLDDEKGYFTPDDPNDDCEQTTFTIYSDANWVHGPDSVREKMKNHWASQVFIKISGTPVLDKLRANKQLKVVHV